MKLEDTVYIVIACRTTTNDDLESDFILNGNHFLIVAIERANMLEIGAAEEKLEKAFPNHLIMTTYLPLMHIIDIAIRKQDLEAEIAKSGQAFHHKDKSHRLDDAFNWENRHNPVLHNGSC